MRFDIEPTGSELRAEKMQNWMNYIDPIPGIQGSDCRGGRVKGGGLPVEQELRKLDFHDTTSKENQPKL